MPEEFSATAVREQLARVSASKGFARNERLSGFLKFVVEGQLEGRTGDLKESVIGTEVFGRKPDYDPKSDAVVRTEAIRLRARLEKYYGGEGRADALVIDLPKGGYVPAFRARSAAPAMKPWLPVALAAGFALIGVLALWWFGRANEPISIAVLPLENLSHDSAEDYFADGLTDEIIRNLSLIEGLAVRSRTSSFALKGAKRDSARTTGNQLGTEYILEGSVARSGDTLRVNAQLVRVKDDTPVWTGKFDRNSKDIFSIQDEISLGIVNELRLQLGKGRRRYETSVEAYDLFLRATAGTRIVSPENQSAQRIEALQTVIEKDPSFAPAYAALASLYAIRAIQFPTPHSPDETPKMTSLAEKALQLDPLLSDAHTASALVLARSARWSDAEASFRRAIALDPNNSSTYVHFVLRHLLVLDRNQEGVELLQHAVQIDPLADDVHAALAQVLTLTGQYSEAAKHCALLAATDTVKSRCMARAQWGLGKSQEAIRLLENDPFHATQPMSRGTLGNYLARTGQTDRAKQMAAAAELPIEQALIYAGLQDKQRTLDALHRMAYLGAQRIGTLISSPELEFLRGDPDLGQLRQKVGLPN